MLQLAVDEADSLPASHRAISDPGVTVWRDGVGIPWGYGYADTSGHWMFVPEVGSFWFGPHARVIRARPRAGTPPGRLREVYERGVLPLALQALGLEVLHASAVNLGRGVIALCGVSGSGKSTMAHALAERGHHPSADDAVALDLSDESPRMIPLPFRIRPRPAVGPRAEGWSTQGPAAGNHGLADGTRAEPRPLAALFVLMRTAAAADVDLAPLPPMAAFSAVLPHAYCFSLEDESRKRRMLAAYVRLVTSVPVFQIVFGAGLQRLPAILDAIEGAVTSVRTEAV